MTVNDGVNATTLTSNLEVLNKGEVARADWANDLPGTVSPGDGLDLKLRVPTGATCSGTVTYADASTSVLQNRSEDSAICRWHITVPSSTGSARRTSRSPSPRTTATPS